MEKTQKKILITTPIFYPNDKPHIGSAHSLILADILARSYKLLNYKVFFLTGVDENCDKIVQAAKKKNQDTQIFVDEMAENFQKALKILQISNDKFIRTTDEDHKKTVTYFWTQLFEKGYIYKGEYEGYYSIADESFFSKSSLVDGKAPTGAEVFLEKTPAYFLKTTIFKDKIKNFLISNPDFITPNNRINELLGFIDQEWNDLCISRKNFGWGIPVPNEKENFVIYVWFDALLNYIFGYPNVNGLSSEFWLEGEVIHLLAKDILTFHGVYWPIMLMAGNLNPNFKFPNCKLLVHNWWVINNEKMSKSKKNVIDPLEIIENYGVEALRLFSFKENLMKTDSNFDSKKLVETFNTFAVGKFSNLVFRLWSLLHKNNIDIPEKKSNENFSNKIEFNILSKDFSEYFFNLFAWCDYLNGQIEEHQAWKNLPKAQEIFAETLELIEYFEPIFPGINLKISKHNSPIIFFKRIENH